MTVEKSSFRDNSGYIFHEKGEIFRAVSYSYKDSYEFLLKSGLYDYLINEELLVPHSEEERDFDFPNVFKIIKPPKIDFISYPYEWSFSMLKDAALTTLLIQKAALKHGMILKDGSAYNIQFLKGKAVLIDTLSFSIYKENEPWIAYHQFCKHFLAPLALAALCDVHLMQMLKEFIDGIPLDITKKILRNKSFFNPGIFIHIYLHNSFQNRFSSNGKNVSVNKKWVNKNSQLRLTENLEKVITNLNLKQTKTSWSEYYSEEHITNEYLNNKKSIVKDFLTRADSKRVLDFGANDGEFSKIAAENNLNVIAFDSDHNSIDKCYNYIKKKNINNLIPLVVDVTNPSPSIGWANAERKSFIERLSPGNEEDKENLVLALAIIHHLCIANNVPLNYAAELFSKICGWIIIEFVPKDDPMVKKLLLHREDIFAKYYIEIFENEFQKYFTVLDRKPVSGSGRVIYLMRKIKEI
jgi:hypothetical protein